MNIENQAPDPPEPQPPNSADSQSPHSAAPDSFVKPDGPSANSAPQETSLSTWRHNGKVAHLPKTVRDKINLMIQDGVTYPAIIQRLGEEGKGLNVMNLSRWKDTGYKDWLLEQAFIARTRARQETPGELVRDFDATEVNHAERCRSDYNIERVHLEADQVQKEFGEFVPRRQHDRESKIHQFLRAKFPALFSSSSSLSSSSSVRSSNSALRTPHSAFRLGFDVAASGQGNLASIYIDEAKGDELWLRALVTCRTEDWHFLKTVLFYFLEQLPNLQAAGDESGLGRQICWEASSQFCSRFLKLNFAAKKHDLGFALMNQLSVAEKLFPRAEADIASDFFALRKVYTGTKWAFTESRNTLNLASHCDIAWAAALSTHAHTNRQDQPWALVC